MNTIWVVEQGEYSDYRVVGVFTTKQNAETVAGYLGSDSSISEWPLDPAADAICAGMRQFFVLMLRDGSVERAEVSGPSPYEFAGSVRIWERTKAPAYKGKGIPDALTADVWARDGAHAIKIANEHRTRMIATGEWA